MGSQQSTQPTPHPRLQALRWPVVNSRVLELLRELHKSNLSYLSRIPMDVATLLVGYVQSQPPLDVGLLSTDVTLPYGLVRSRNIGLYRLAPTKGVTYDTVHRHFVWARGEDYLSTYVWWEAVHTNNILAQFKVSHERFDVDMHIAVSTVGDVVLYGGSQFIVALCDGQCPVVKVREHEAADMRIESLLALPNATVAIQFNDLSVRLYSHTGKHLKTVQTYILPRAHLRDGSDELVVHVPERPTEIFAFEKHSLMTHDLLNSTLVVWTNDIVRTYSLDGVPIGEPLVLSNGPILTVMYGKPTGMAVDAAGTIVLASKLALWAFNASGKPIIRRIINKRIGLRSLRGIAITTEIACLFESASQ